MANNYCESSSFIPVPAEKLEQARAIIDRLEVELEESDEGAAGYNAVIETIGADSGVWISHDESINAEHAEGLVRALVDELELPGIHVCSWSYTCSNPRIDEFGGGAFAVQLGFPTIWVDAATHVRQQAEQREKDSFRNSWG